MRVEVHWDGRVLVDGELVAQTNNPREVLRRFKNCGINELVLTGRVVVFGHPELRVQVPDIAVFA